MPVRLICSLGDNGRLGDDGDAVRILRNCKSSCRSPDPARRQTRLLFMRSLADGQQARDASSPAQGLPSFSLFAQRVFWVSVRDEITDTGDDEAFGSDDTAQTGLG